MLAAGSLGAVALSLVLFQYQFRHLEAEAAASVYRSFTPVLAAPSAPVLWFGLGTNNAYGLDIAPDCSSALLVAPLCVLGMMLLIPRKLAVRRVIKGIAVAATVLVTGNLLRIGVIAMAVRVGGLGTGYQVGHLVLGSLVSIVCIAISLALLTAIVASQDGLRLSLRRWLRRTSL